jgi:hypothetical protein
VFEWTLKEWLKYEERIKSDKESLKEDVLKLYIETELFYLTYRKLLHMGGAWDNKQATAMINYYDRNRKKIELVSTEAHHILMNDFEYRHLELAEMIDNKSKEKIYGKNIKIRDLVNNVNRIFNILRLIKVE